MSAVESVTLWIAGVKQAEDEAAQQLWNRYFEQLVRLARRKLAGGRRRIADEEDVALSAFHSFCQAARKGRFPKLTDRDGLWRLLMQMTARKAISQLRREGARKRGGGLVRGESALMGPDGSLTPAGLNQVVGEMPTPEFAALVAEECGALFDQLEPDLQEIAMAKMQGQTNAEIAAQRDCSVSTIERSLRLIRKLWERENEA